MLNKITLMGRLTAEPELRTTNSGVSVASFTVACERDFAQGGQKETDFIACVAWRQTGEFVSRYFRKGSMIVVDGRLQSRKWQDRDGNKRVAWEVNADHCYFGESRRQEDSTQGYQPPPRAPVNVDPPQGFDGFREMPGTGAGNPFTDIGQQEDMFGDDGELPF